MAALTDNPTLFPTHFLQEAKQVRSGLYRAAMCNACEFSHQNPVLQLSRKSLHQWLVALPHAAGRGDPAQLPAALGNAASV